MVFPCVRVACIICYLCGFLNAKANEMTVWSMGRDMLFTVLILPGYHS